MTLEQYIEVLREVANSYHYALVRDVALEPYHYSGETLFMKIAARDMTDEDYRRIKSVFGPLEFKNDYGDQKKAVGDVVISEHLTVKVHVSGAMVCEKLDVSGDGPSEAEMADIVTRIKSGEIPVVTCRPAELRAQDEKAKGAA